MASALEMQALTVLEAAAALPLGLVLRTNDSYRARQILYRFRRDNAALRCIQIRLSPNDPDHELWLIRQEATAESAAESALSSAADLEL